LSKRKGFDRVLRAFARCREHDSSLRLAIVGGPGLEGDESVALDTLARELGIVGSVTFAGARPPDSVAIWLAASDLFVFASDYEGCPNVLWEALATGRPVVSSNVGDAAQIVPPQGGIVFEPARDVDRLTRAIQDALAREWSSTAIRAYAEQHTWHSVAERVAREWRLAVEPPADASAVEKIA
jgi:glycosyltransferase involved in cell wall biosynthesis